MATRAGVSEDVFHEVFPSVEQCYQAAFEQGLRRLSGTVDEAVGREGAWLDRLRAGLVAFLGFLDDEPAWGRLLVSDAPLSDQELRLRCQQRVLGVLTSLLDDGASQAAGELIPAPMLTSELVIGGAISVIRTQMLKRRGTVLVGLAPSLMSFIVRPYLGQVAANAEREGRSTVNRDTGATTLVPSRETELAQAAALPIRVTHRTTLVLRAIAQAPYSNNREVAQAAGLVDEGQASKLLARLERQGMIENVGVGAARGEPNAWLLTSAGRRVVVLLGERSDTKASRRSRREIRGAA